MNDTLVSINQCFHKDNNECIYDGGRDCLRVSIGSIRARYNTLPIEVLHMAKQYKFLKIVTVDSVNLASTSHGYVEFIGLVDEEGIDVTTLQRSGDFWFLVTKLILEERLGTIISDTLKTYYANVVETYTMNQIQHLVNVIRGDLANQPKLIKQLLNMVEKEV